MDKKTNIFDFLSRVFTVFGITIFIMCFICRIFGDIAKEISELFVLGSKGLSIRTIMQFFAISTILSVFRLIFMSDCLIKKMPLILRTVLMFTSIVAAVVVFILSFGWFPADNTTAWFMFAACFTVCSAVGALISWIREKQENKRLEKALQNIKEELGS